jgi:molybdopterin-guanine dinucleotide biosynthesis protein A
LYKDISGIILAGGKSSRMGTDKALLKVGDEKIIEKIVRLIQPLFKNVLIITNTPTDYDFLKIPLYEDIYKHRGPLSGIHSGLVHSTTEKNFIISCDLPFLSEQLIRYVVEYDSNKPVRYCFTANRHNYLAGIYSKEIISDVERILSGGIRTSDKKEKLYSVKNLFNNIEAEIILVEKLSFYSDELFFNINTPEDFKHLNKISKSR